MDWDLAISSSYQWKGLKSHRHRDKDIIWTEIWSSQVLITEWLEMAGNGSISFTPFQKNSKRRQKKVYFKELKVRRKNCPKKKIKPFPKKCQKVSKRCQKFSKKNLKVGEKKGFPVWLQMALNCFKWLEMNTNGFKWV